MQDATGIQCQFDTVNVLVNGKNEVRLHYSPVKDDIISRE
jgi:hypothetical protein